MNTSPGSSSIEHMAGWDGLLRHNVKVLTAILGAKNTYEMSEKIYDELLEERAAAGRVAAGSARKRKILSVSTDDEVGEGETRLGGDGEEETRRGEGETRLGGDGEEETRLGEVVGGEVVGGGGDDEEETRVDIEPSDSD